MKYMVERVREYINRKTVRARMRKVISILCCVVVFVTTYALVLPSLALEKTAICGKEEHEHSADCYSRELICGQEESEEHQHTDECYEDVLTCGKEIHVHSLDCYEVEEPEEEEPAQEPEESAVAETTQASANETEEPEETAAPEETEEPEETVEEKEEEPAPAEPEETVDEQEEDEQETPAVEEPQEQEPEDDSVEEQKEEKSDSGKTEKADKADTTKEAEKKEGVAEPEKLGKIDFADLLTNDTDVYYLPENAGSDDWEAIDGNVKLDPEETVILHIAYEIPAGKLNATNTETEYYLPIEIAMSDKEVEAVNKYQSTVFDGTDRKSDDLKKAGEFEIKEKTNDKGDVTERKLVIRFNDYAAGKVGGEKLTDGTVTAEPQKIEGFLELTVSAADLLTLEKVDDAAFKLEWNDDDRLDTTVHFDEEKLAAFENKDKEEAAEETAKKDEEKQPEKKQPEKKVVIQEIEEEKPAETEAPAQEQTEETAKTEEAAEEVKYASGRLTFDGGSYTVTADFDESAKLPEGVQLKATELQGATYDMYLNKAQDAVDEGKEVTGARFFDITFVNTNGEPVEPQGMVDIKIQYKNSETIDKDASVEGLHFTEEGAENVDVETKGIADNHVDVVTFQSDSFSVYGILYTVDFEIVNPETGKVYTYSLEGGKSINLTELLVILGIKSEDEVEKFVAEDVTDVKFSNPELVRVTHKGKFLGLFGTEDWLLESLQPFDTEETLTIMLKNGSSIVVKVTDAQDDVANGIWDLANTDNTQFLNVSASSTVTETEQERNAAFKLTVAYSLEEDVVRAMDAFEGHPTLVYDLSSVVENSPASAFIGSGTIMMGSRKIASYRIHDNKVTIEITDTAYLDGRTSLTGYFTMTLETDETELGDNNEWTYTFPGTGSTVPIHYKKKVEEGSKSLHTTTDTAGNKILHYTADINVNSALDSMTFVDTLSGLQTLDTSSVKINGTPVSVTTTSNGFTFDVGSALGTSGIAAGNYKVTYETKVTDEQLRQMAADKTTEKNRADWTVNGDKEVPGGETEIEFEKPKTPIPVTKRIADGRTTHNPGDTIDYSIVYGDENTDLSGFEIADRMTDLQTLDGDITITYNGTSITMPASSIIADDGQYSRNMVNLFDYTFPEGTAGKGPVTVTYKTKVIDAETAKANGIYDTTILSNIAEEKRQNTTSTTTTRVPFEKEQIIRVDKTASHNGNVVPGQTIDYTLTIGDADTEMAGVNIRDVMTDMQTLQGDVMIKVGNGAAVRLKDYVAGAITYTDDGAYSQNDVELFNFIMPATAGKGPVVITYSTTVISVDQAHANNIYGDIHIKNTGHGGKGSDGTDGVGPFGEYPIAKTVTQNGNDVNGQTVEMDSTVHYTMTVGDASMNLANALIYDEMTDLQKLVSAVTITKANGDSFTMPVATGQYAENGVVWNYFDDGKYSTAPVRVFNYRLPADIGYGPITIEYDAQIISEEEANENAIKGTQAALNRFRENNREVTTNIDIEFPGSPYHNPTIHKEFDHFDLANSILYWNIIVEKDKNSAYPIEKVTVAEVLDDLHITEPNQGYNNDGGGRGFFASDFDMVHAIVTTDDGTILTPGVDYTIDKDNAKFVFEPLNERVHINLAFKSPAKVIHGYKMTNKVKIEEPYTIATAEAEYNNPGIALMKNGEYTEDSRLIKWEVQLNPAKLPFDDSDPVQILFSDQIPNGLELVNYTTKKTDDPTISVVIAGGNIWVDPPGHEFSVTVDSENKIQPIDIAAHTSWTYGEAGLNKHKYIVTYYTRVSDEEWDRITSSASGREDFENHAQVTAGDGKSFEGTDTVTVTSDEYLMKHDTTVEDDHGIVIDYDEESGDKITSKKISYQIDINPHGYNLNENNPLTLTDYISTNMDINTESVKLYNAARDAEGNVRKDEKGRLIPDAEFAEEFEMSYNDDSRLLALRNIPDNTPLVLVYSCTARSQGDGTFQNTATLIGGGSHSSTVVENHTVQMNDAGFSVDGILMQLRKIDENNISKNLAGAEFTLYECDLAIGSMTNPEDYPQSYWDDLLEKVNRMSRGTASAEEIDYVNTNFKITGYRKAEVSEDYTNPVTTGENGTTQWGGLSEHKLYAWVESKSPDDYTGYAPDDYHYFVGYQHLDVNSGEIPQPLLPIEEQRNRQNAAWALDDAVQFANGVRVASMANISVWTATNVESKYTSIDATKVWEGDSNDLFETRPTAGIKLQLWRINPDGTKEIVGHPVAINADSEGNWPTYIWNRLPAEDRDGNKYKYTVVEEKVENYSTTYSDKGEGITSGNITVTNKMIPKNTEISIEKRFDEGDNNLPNEIAVTLKKFRTDKDGNKTGPFDTDYETRLNAGNEWKYTFSGLPTKEAEDGVAYDLTYTAVEDTAALERDGFKYTVTYSDNGNGVIEATQDNPLVIKNSVPKGNLVISKKLIGDVTGNEDKEFKVTIKNSKGKFLQSDSKSFGDNAYEFTVTAASELTIEGLPLDEYTVEEKTGTGYTDIIDGYAWVESGSITSVTVNVTNDQDTPAKAELVNKYVTGSVKVTKGFTGIDNLPNGFKITATYNDGSEDHSVKLTVGSEGMTGTGTVADPYTWTISELPIGTVVTFTESGYDVEGYSVTITGSSTADDKSTAVAKAASEPGVARFVNTYDRSNKGFEFTKIWKNANGTTYDEWQKDITVDVSRRETGETTADNNFKLTYEIKKDAAGTVVATLTSTVPEDLDRPTYAMTVEKVGTGTAVKYKFTIGNVLDKYSSDSKEWQYYVIEESGIAGYQNPKYGSNISGQPSEKSGDDADKAFDGEFIINVPEDAVTLPESGGIGTTLFTILGSILSIFAAVMLYMRRQRLMTVKMAANKRMNNKRTSRRGGGGLL